MTNSLDKEKLLSILPPVKEGPFLANIQQLKKGKIDTIIVLDDDPTGTQTVYDVPVLTDWSFEAILREFNLGSPLFFILTNSRSLTEEESTKITQQIGENIRKAAKEANTSFWVISRSDSTLRGHYPSEVTALAVGLDWEQPVQFIIPAFFEGGRYTVNDVHYVQKGQQFIPASETPYAKDKVFGYQYANLKSWVAEKNNGLIKADSVATISIEALRTQPLKALVEQINQLKNGDVCVVNAADYADLLQLTIALLKSNIRPIFRTAASFVRAVAGLAEKKLLDGKRLTSGTEKGGLTIVGSYVPTSTSQLRHLLSHQAELVKIEISVEQLLAENNFERAYQTYANTISEQLQKGQSVVLFTSRKLITATSEEANQQIGKRISRFLTQIVGHLTVCPAYLLTKGGITSSDIATKSIGVQRAMVKGQIIKGVPVWELGPETKFPKSHQIIFPGNVGTESSLTEVIRKLEI
ncbi:MAG: four-carbon acid sugar kinase family protein [Bacteroidota bacterium]